MKLNNVHVLLVYAVKPGQTSVVLSVSSDYEHCRIAPFYSYTVYTTIFFHTCQIKWKCIKLVIIVLLFMITWKTIYQTMSLETTPDID